MYKIIGADGKEYGPISGEVLRQWIQQGRANAQTRALAPGASEWRPLCELSEFSDLFGAKLGPASPPPLTAVVDAEALAREILARDYDFSIGQCIGRGWDLVMSNFWLTVGATFIIILVTTAVGAVPFGGLLLNYVFWSGLDWMFLKMIRGERAELGDSFAGFSLAFVPLMLFSIVGQLLVGIGFLLCLLPGIYLMVAWLMFAGLLIIDKKLDFWDAMELSRKVVTRHWWKVFGLLLVCLLLLIVGLLVCLVGVFIAVPVVTAATVYAYEDIFGTKSSATAIPASPSSPEVSGPVVS
jgi:hypothetical protein